MSFAPPRAVGWFNFVVYQVGWFAAILGAAHGYAVLGTAIALLAAAASVWIQRDPLDARLLVVAVVAGLIVDTTLIATDLVRFESAWPIGVAPYWMLALWIGFATTLNRSMRWSMRSPVIAALAGAIGGPAAYLAGAKLGALSLPSPAPGLALVAVLWTVAMSVFGLVVRNESLTPARSVAR